MKSVIPESARAETPPKCLATALEIPAIPRGFGRGPRSGSSGDGRVTRPMVK
jgi:hypothetical protein